MQVLCIEINSAPRGVELEIERWRGLCSGGSNRTLTSKNCIGVGFLSSHPIDSITAIALEMTRTVNWKNQLSINKHYKPSVV